MRECSSVIAFKVLDCCTHLTLSVRICPDSELTRAIMAATRQCPVAQIVEASVEKGRGRKREQTESGGDGKEGARGTTKVLIVDASWSVSSFFVPSRKLKASTCG